MARKRRSRETRDAPAIATPVRFHIEPAKPVSVRYSLLDDRRTFHPEGPDRQPLTLTNQRPLIGIDDARSSQKQQMRGFRPRSQTMASMVFTNPNEPSRLSRDVSICIRRKTRREVLFAKRKNGGGNKRPRFTNYSKIRCD